MPVLVEVCVDSIASGAAAVAGGAHRIELCAALHDGGTTPSAGMIAAARALGAVAVHVLIRPRGGDFVYGPSELGVMRRDIEIAKSLGADGVATGILASSGAVDGGRLTQLVRTAAPLPVVFHRAFDASADLSASLEVLIDCGVREVLTSGGASSAVDGIPALASLVSRGAGRIRIMAGGGVRPHNAARIVAETGVDAVHTRLDRVRSGVGGGGPLPLRRPFPTGDYDWEETDAGEVAKLVESLSGRPRQASS